MSRYGKRVFRDALLRNLNAMLRLPAFQDCQDTLMSRASSWAKRGLLFRPGLPWGADLPVDGHPYGLWRAGVPFAGAIEDVGDLWPVHEKALDEFCEERRLVWNAASGRGSFTQGPCEIVVFSRVDKLWPAEVQIAKLDRQQIEAVALGELHSAGVRD